MGLSHILRPTGSATTKSPVPIYGSFTGTRSIEQLIATFSRKTPFCLSYVSHQFATPYGVVFNRKNSMRSARRASASGTFSLAPVNGQTTLCERKPEGIAVAGTWKINTFRGHACLSSIRHQVSKVRTSACNP